MFHRIDAKTILCIHYVQIFQRIDVITAVISFVQTKVLQWTIYKGKMLQGSMLQEQYGIQKCRLYTL